MYSINKLIKTISLIGAFALAVTTARAVTPAPDGGYPGQNTAEGDDALLNLVIGTTTGISNTAIGFNALLSNTDGRENTAIGSQALLSNTNGIFNTATGVQALFRNTTGLSNTATGWVALQLNTTGNNNTATGVAALDHNTVGSFNTATGVEALENTTGSSNIALGFMAGVNLTTGNNNIDIGNAGVAGESGIIRIGTQGTQTKTFIAGIRGTVITGGVAVGVDVNGQLGVRASSARFKEAIKPMDKASEAIFSLQPVTFRYKKALDPEGLPQFGLVAEQVAKVDPDLVARDVDGKPYTVRYEEVNAMLLNEFLKEHRKVEQQATTIAQQRKDFQASITKLEATVAQQRKGMEALTASLKEQGSQIQKVSAQLELNKPAPRTVDNQ